MSMGIKQDVLVNIIEDEDQVLTCPPVFQGWQLKSLKSIRIGKIRKFRNKFCRAPLYTFNSSYFSFGDGTPYRATVFQMRSDQRFI